MPKRRCDEPTCIYPFAGTTKANHRAEYHSGGHAFLYLGTLVRVHRRSDGKIPCPCGLESHARYSFKKLTALNKQLPHPGPEASEWSDHPLNSRANPSPAPPLSSPIPTSTDIEQTTSSSSHEPQCSSQQHSPGQDTLSPPPNSSGSALEVRHGSDMAQEGSEGVHHVDDDVEGLDLGYRSGIEVHEDVEMRDRVGEIVEDGDTTGDEGLSEEGEPSDEDAQQTDDSMAIDSVSRQDAINSLARFNTLVEPAYHLVVCTECAIPVRMDDMYIHQKTRHFQSLHLPPELKLPSRAQFRSLVVALDADKPLDVPVGPILRIQGVQIVQGMRCAISGCVGAVFGVSKGISRPLQRHQLRDHPEVAIADRRSVVVPSHPLSNSRKDRRFVEVLPTTSSTSCSLRHIEKVANSCSLLEHEQVFTLASNEREKNAVFAQSRWDEVLDGVNLTSLMATISSSKRDAYVSFKRLKAVAREYYKEVTERLSTLPVLTRRYILSSSTTNLKHQPFRRPQEMKTVLEDSDRTAQFLAFLIVHINTPVDHFPIPLHPEVTAHLESLSLNLSNESTPDSELGNLIHEAVWLILSRPSTQYIQNELMCPFTRFIIAATLKDSGSFVRAKVITPVMAQAQWCFRATAAEEVIRLQSAYNGDSLLAYKTHVERYLTDGYPVLFTTLRQNMNFLRALASRQQGLARFNWNVERTVISIDGFPIAVSSYIRGIHTTIKTVTSQIDHLFRGCRYSDILQLIDDAMVPAQSGQPRWFRDRPTADKIRYSFFEEAENGLQELRPRLLNHLIEDPQLFTAVDDKLIPKNGAILRWFSELDEVVRGLYYLISTTWGGGSRGTEIEHLLYANHPRNLRNVFIINGLLTIVTEYQKTQSIAGAGKLIARTPAFQVNRLLILVLGVAYWAAGYIGCYIGMEKLNCQRYFYEVFVITGISMDSKDFSKVLGSLNSTHLGIDLKLSDFRQLSACMLISSTSTSFFDPNDEDPNVVAAHESFGHSLEMGRVNYGLDSTSEATGLAADAVAHMQQVSTRWQVFLKLVHPVLEQQVERGTPGAGHNSSSVNAHITSQFLSFTSFVDERFNGFEKRTQATIRREIESMGIQILEQIRTAKDIPSYHNPRRSSVHPAARQALKAVLRRKFNPLIGFTSPEQAELVNSVGSSLHVFGIIETGGGKSLAFFGAPFLFPHHLFIVVSPLIALTQDLRRRLLETGINGGVWNEETIDFHAAQLILVSAHKAGTDEFHNWITSEGVRLRLKRIFIDEAHKIATDQKFRSCFKRFSYLTRSSVPITFLSGSLMPKSMPKILETMGIKDTSLVDEIRRYSGRRNLKYIVEKVEDEEEIVLKILEFVRAETGKMGSEDRGIIFTRTRKDAESIAEALEVPLYLGGMSNEERGEAENRWRKRVNTQDRWIVATQAFGQGVDYPHVRRVIHLDPMDLLDYFQETARSGRDGLPAICHTFYSKLPPPLADPNETDHSGRGDMISFLQTDHCLRMSFACFDRVTHSCIALNGELCSNCENLQEVPYELGVRG
ncbi:dna partial [Lentinula edodes]|uniref:DNA 3'-5' helicase n=1 Tax=Lentinula edodes TaxID=5353 RepID=A0A1Q3ERI2_LENED|nr:dna partial [Lentinula edodes]